MWTRCPAPERLAAFADDTLEDATRQAVLMHLARCDRCLDTLATVSRASGTVAVRVPDALLVQARAAADRHTPLPAMRWAPAGVALTVILLAATVMLQPLRREPAMTPGTGPEVARQVRNTAAMPSVPRITVPTDDDVVEIGSLRFEWSPVADAVFYHVRIAGDDGALVWEGRAPGDRTEVSADADVVPGRRYYVTVTAHAASERVQRSTAVAFTVARRES